MHPGTALQDLIHGGLKLFQGTDVVHRNGNAASHADQRSVGALQVDPPSGKTAQTGAHCLLDTAEIPIKYMVGNGYGAFFQNFPVFAQVLLAVDAQAVGDIQQPAEHAGAHEPIQRPFALVNKGFIQIGIVLVHHHIPQVRHFDHVLIASVGVNIVQFVPIIHKSPHFHHFMPIYHIPGQKTTY